MILSSYLTINIDCCFYKIKNKNYKTTHNLNEYI